MLTFIEVTVDGATKVVINLDNVESIHESAGGKTTRFQMASGYSVFATTSFAECKEYVEACIKGFNYKQLSRSDND